MEQKYSKSSNYTVLGPKKASIAVYVLLDLQEINENLNVFWKCKTNQNSQKGSVVRSK